MAIRDFLDGQSFDPEAINSMSIALTGACIALGLKPGPDAANRLLAMRIIDLAGLGERDPERLKAAALDGFRH